MTGLRFEYRLYPTLDEAFGSGADVIFGIPDHYAPDGMILSRPFLTSKTILYLHSSVDSNKLCDKTYAAVKGSALPDGIKEENAVYFDTREQSLDAVNAGRVDYGYGNAYSVSFYTIQNNYQNLVTIPAEKESRAYCMGFLIRNDELISIIDRAIGSIDDAHLQSLILDVSSRIDRKISPAMVMEAYGIPILFALLAVLGFLLFCVALYLRINNRLRLQNQRHEILSSISNEYLYEYFVKDGRLVLSDQCARLFSADVPGGGAMDALKAVLSKDDAPETVSLPLPNGETRVFRVVSQCILDSKEKLDSIIGKLIDISAQTAEKEELIIRSQTDGLTGLYNAATTREFIAERLRHGDPRGTDALILVDCDSFKVINDTLGHLAGDRVLEQIGGLLKLAFRSSDILGRMGGDEFGILLKDVPSASFVKAKCRELSVTIKEAVTEAEVSVSVGIALTAGDASYEDLFKRADDALYHAKRQGGGRIVCHDVPQASP